MENLKVEKEEKFSNWEKKANKKTKREKIAHTKNNKLKWSPNNGRNIVSYLYLSYNLKFMFTNVVCKNLEKMFKLSWIFQRLRLAVALCLDIFIPGFLIILKEHYYREMKMKLSSVLFSNVLFVLSFHTSIQKESGNNFSKADHLRLQKK